MNNMNHRNAINDPKNANLSNNTHNANPNKSNSDEHDHEDQNNAQSKINNPAR